MYFLSFHLHEPKIHDERVEKEEEADDVPNEAETGDDQGACAQVDPKERLHFWETHFPDFGLALETWIFIPFSMNLLSLCPDQSLCVLNNPVNNSTICFES